jgi:site-specific DNA-methyltransferase (adenine-specific)
MKDYLNKIIQGDCLEVMKDIPDKSIDMILCDLPYGTTACSWDTIIPFEPLWEQYKRIIKDNGAIVLTASQPFTSALVMSNPNWFRYELIWEKDNSSNFMLLKKQFGKRHENIVVFYNSHPVYNPQMIEGVQSHSTGKNIGKIQGKREYIGIKDFKIQKVEKTNLKYPTSILKFNACGRGLAMHPTQKPVALFEYLIKTYTNEGELVLDNCIGSGTTAVACKNLNRNFIGIEKEEQYCKIAEDRLRQEVLL